MIPQHRYGNPPNNEVQQGLEHVDTKLACRPDFCTWMVTRSDLDGCDVDWKDGDRGKLELT
jgi:hypothetical protein